MIKKLFLLLSILIVPSVKAWFKETQIDYALHKQDYAKAQGLVNDLLIEQPNNPYALYNAGQLAYTHKNCKEAYSYFKTAAQKAQDQRSCDKLLAIQAWYQAGNSSVEEKEWQQALTAFKEVISLDPDNIFAQKMIEQLEKLLSEKEKEQQQDQSKSQKSDNDSEDKNKENKSEQGQNDNQSPGGQGNQDKDQPSDQSQEQKGMEEEQKDNERKSKQHHKDDNTLNKDEKQTSADKKSSPSNKVPDNKSHNGEEKDLPQSTKKPEPANKPDKTDSLHQSPAPGQGAQEKEGKQASEQELKKPTSSLAALSGHQQLLLQKAQEIDGKGTKAFLMRHAQNQEKGYESKNNW